MAIFNNSDPISLTTRILAQQNDGRKTIDVGSFKGIQDLRPSQGDMDKDDFVETNFYLICNEVEQEKTLAALAPAVPSDHSVHLGFSMNFNFDLIAKRSPYYAIIADIAPQMLRCYHDLTHCILKSPNRQEFVRNFDSFLQENAEYYFGLANGQDISILCNLREEMNRPGSWLSTDEGFFNVKKIHEEGRVLYLKLNLTDSEGAFESIDQWLTINKLTLDTVYLSNIPEWLHPSNESPSPSALRYLDNICKIIAPTTYVIDAYKCDKRLNRYPVQRLSKGTVTLPCYVLTHKPPLQMSSLLTSSNKHLSARKTFSFSTEKGTEKKGEGMEEKALNPLKRRSDTPLAVRKTCSFSPAEENEKKGKKLKEKVLTTLKRMSDPEGPVSEFNIRPPIRHKLFTQK